MIIANAGYLSYLLDGRETRRITPPAGGFWELGGFPSTAANPWEAADNPIMAPFDQKVRFLKVHLCLTFPYTELLHSCIKLSAVLLATKSCCGRN